MGQLADLTSQGHKKSFLFSLKNRTVVKETKSRSDQFYAAFVTFGYMMRIMMLMMADINIFFLTNWGLDVEMTISEKTRTLKLYHYRKTDKAAVILN